MERQLRASALVEEEKVREQMGEFVRPQDEDWLVSGV
jgi:hypothetical protein